MAVIMIKNQSRHILYYLFGGRPIHMLFTWVSLQMDNRQVCLLSSILKETCYHKNILKPTPLAVIPRPERLAALRQPGTSMTCVSRYAILVSLAITSSLRKWKSSFPDSFLDVLNYRFHKIRDKRESKISIKREQE